MSYITWPVLGAAAGLRCTYDRQAVAECVTSAGDGSSSFLNKAIIPYALGGTNNCLDTASSVISKLTECCMLRRCSKTGSCLPAIQPESNT